MLDCELLREVYINLLDAKEPKFDLSMKSNDKNIIKNRVYSKIVLKVTDTEVNLHKNFLKKDLKKNFY